MRIVTSASPAGVQLSSVRSATSISLRPDLCLAGVASVCARETTAITFMPGAEPLFQYRIRNVQPAPTTCVTLNIDLNAPNTLTLYGAM